MLGSLIKMIAYSKAPKTTYAVLHPRNSARLAKTQWDLRHADAPRVSALAAVLIALPVGYVIGRLTAPRISRQWHNDVEEMGFDERNPLPHTYE